MHLNVLSVHGENQMGVLIDTENLPNGNYTLTIPAGAITLNDDPEALSREIKLNYVLNTPTSIDTILAGDADLDVTLCTVSGIVLYNGPASEMPRNLAPGFYIVNGIKIRL